MKPENSDPAGLEPASPIIENANLATERAEAGKEVGTSIKIVSFNFCEW